MPISEQVIEPQCGGGWMPEPDNPKKISAEEFESLCIQARGAAAGGDECSLLHSLCRTLISDLGCGGIECPPASAGTTALMDVLLCDYLVHRYERENSFDPFPILQMYLLSEQSSR
jgi:hypothetical protein